MSDEFDALPAVPVEGDGEGLGQAEDGDAKATTPTPGPTEADIAALKSKKDKEVAAAQKRAEAAEAQARIAASNLAAMQRAMQAVDPDAYNAAASQAVIEAQKAQLQEYEYREQVSAFKEQWADKADSIEAGLSASAEYKDAVRDALSTGDSTPLLELLSDKRAEKRWAERSKERPAPQESEDEAMKRQSQKAGAVPVTTGAAAPANQSQQKIEHLREQRQTEMKAAQASGQINTQYAVIKNKYRQLAKEQGIDPTALEG